MRRLLPLRRCSALLLLASVACTGAARPVEKPVALVVGKSPAGAGSPEPPLLEGPHATCAVVPLSLVMRMPDRKNDFPIVTLDARGAVAASALFDMSQRPTPLGRLDANGCMTGDDGAILADASTAAEVWTPVASYPIDVPRAAMRVETSGRAAYFDSGGAIVWLGADGRPSATAEGFAFDGYRDGSECAARVLLAVFFSMMPSMAMSDGHPKKLAPPPMSRCAHR